jgi:hypothetical protein
MLGRSVRISDRRRPRVLRGVSEGRSASGVDGVAVSAARAAAAIASRGFAMVRASRLRFKANRGAKSKTPELGKTSSGGCLDISLTMSYFHTGTRTIIGAEAFHCPVRDGKEWDHLAMVIRLNLSPGSSRELPSQFIEISNRVYDCWQQTGKHYL